MSRRLALHDVPAVPATTTSTWRRRWQAARHMVSSSAWFAAGLPGSFFSLGGRGAVWGSWTCTLAAAAWAGLPAHVPALRGIAVTLLATSAAARAGSRSQAAARTRRRLAWRGEHAERLLLLEAELQRPVSRSVPSMRAG